MVRRTRIVTGALVGAIGGLGWYAADVAGAFSATEGHRDLSAGQGVVIALSALALAVLTAAGTALVAGLWPRRLAWRPPAWLTVAAAAAALVVAFGASHVRRLPDRPLTLAPPSAAPIPGARSLLFVVVDTLRADTLYGPGLSFPLTPRVGAWAREQTVFTDVEAAASWTMPSMATMITGILPERHYASRGYLPSWAPTLAGRLRAAGYDTVGLVDNDILERRAGFGDGFERYDLKTAVHFPFTLTAFRLLPEALQRRVYERGAPELTARALAALAEPRTRPLMLYVHYMDPHEPYFGDDAAPDPPGSESVESMRAMTRARSGTPPTPAALAFLRHRYEVEVRSLDGPLSSLVTAFGQRYGDDGVIVVTSDHGEEFLEHGELGHGHSLHREIVHVPLILSLGGALPPARRAQRVTAPVNLVDLAPTLLDAAGVGPAVGGDGITMDGVSRLHELRGESPVAARPLFATSTLFGRRIYRWREGPRAMIITFRKGDEQRELFGLDDDPKERHDLAASQVEALDGMDVRMQGSNDYQVKARDPLPSTTRGNAESLRALGYTQ